MSARPERPPSASPVYFSGHPPSAALARLLALGGVLLARTADTGQMHVVVTDRADRLPPVPRVAVPWIWLSPKPAPGALIAAAAAAGAVDVVDGSAPVAAVAARLLARVAEQSLPVEGPPEVADLVHSSPASRRLLAEVYLAARTSMPVLLTGETGTGKEVAARLLHSWSGRRARRFVPINCGAIPNELLEAELFGYAKGAFSGAVQSYEGQIAAAEGGTVFLDEVDDTPHSFQIKLLRVLEDRVVSRLGANDWHKVDFRILAATNRDLPELIGRGLFGTDLYERLAIVSIRLPPLRDRLADLPALCQHLFARFYTEEPAARSRHQVSEVTPEAHAMLAAHSWPGNIRELRNVLYSALVRKRTGSTLLVSDLAMGQFRGGGPPPRTSPPAGLVDREALALDIQRGTFNLRAALESFERSALTAALERAHGNAAKAAALLGEVGRGTARDPGATVRAMMRRLGLT